MKHIGLPAKLTVFFAASLFKLFAGGSNHTAPAPVPEFGDYWFRGKAELTSYKLQQARYGEIHKGDAVLIFVTEDFLPQKQVKYEWGPKQEKPETVLKLNFTRKFNTGIYPYSIMSSVFSPVDLSKMHAYKVSSSSQEWCGHTYMQINNRGDRYDVMLHSYFQKEADQQLALQPAWLEDELWTRIRLNPESLPLGTVKMIPGLQYVRLRHKPVKILTATTALQKNDAEWVYSVKYQNDERSLRIRFESKVPYRILGWEESYISGFGDGAHLLTTTAERNKEIWLDYWSKNSVADSTWRNRLGLE